MEIVVFLFKWAHLLFGITWIGLLFYFNFVQTEYFKEASPEGLSDAKAKLAPRALAWFRWSALFTFATGAFLLVGLFHTSLVNEFILLGSLMGTLMMLNVWHIIWPKQKIVLGLADGDAAAAAPKAALASRSNALFSGPMAFCMLASPHLGYSADYLVAASGLGLGFWIACALIIAVELNAIFGKMGPIASIRGVIHMSLAFAAAIFCLLLFL
ncbi:urate hydroxylase PuuD [Agaribacterium haliotis]|uniref:urate hydroxylase PuuD n=1 Tax=Agaribacterium haliotis TaxID=2013869 RepID=UPI000BB52DD9|nr:urate hydroxylase PuuD [Agaribacterium haliotis]